MTRHRTHLEQAMPSVPAGARWAFADEMLWEAIERGENVPRGRNGRTLFRAMRLARFVGLGSAAVWAVAAAEAARLLARQALSSPEPVTPSGRPAAVFVGFGARAEASLFREYETAAAAHADVFLVDQTSLARAGRPGRARVSDVWRSLAQAVRDIRPGMTALAERHSTRAADFLTTAAARAGNYAFARAWWMDVSRRRDVTEACFLAADVCAFAAASVGVRCIYLQHGLLSRTLWFPEFDEAHPLTRYERQYLRARLPNATVHPSRLQVAVASPERARRLLVASGWRSHDEMMLVAPLMRHLSERGFTIHVRLFNGEPMSRFWGTADLGVPWSAVDTGPSFDQVLTEINPAFVASWSSTALVEALYRGTIPICVARPDDFYVNAAVFPLFRCCLNWPRQQPAIDDVLASAESYHATLQSLRAEECDLGAERIA